MVKYRMSYPDRHKVLTRIYERKRARILSSNLAICDLEHLTYPNHRTGICILSRVPNPDVVVAYTYGGHIPHHFYKQDDGTISDTTGEHHQFTWEWIEHWLDQNVAVAIFDVPDYFLAFGKGWVSSFYRLSPDRVREAHQMLALLETRFPDSTLCWFGVSYGALEAAAISLEETNLHKIASSSGTWYTKPDIDLYHQGARLDWYTVADSKTPVLIVMHEKEVREKAQEQMQLTESLLVTNDVSEDDGHFFRERQAEVVAAICNWFRDKPIPKIIP
jgi:hypothetical protein